MFEFLYISSQITVLLVLVLTSANRSRFIFWLAFLIPLNSVSFEAGVLYSWAKIAFPITLCVIALHRKTWASSAESVNSIRSDFIWFKGFLWYATALTCVWMIVDFESGYTSMRATYLGPLQSTLRSPVQLVSFVSQWGMIFAGFWVTRSSDDVSIMIRGYLWGNLLNALTGFYQVLASKVGLPWLSGAWILRREIFNPDTTEDIVGVGPLALNRLSGLGGEPKHAAINFVVILFLLSILYIFGDGKIELKRWPVKALIIFMAFLLTLSVGAWSSLLVGTAYIMVSAFFTHRYKVTLWLSLLFFFVCTLVSIAGYKNVLQLYDSYASIKLSDQAVARYTDYAVIDMLVEEPARLLVGQGAGGSERLSPVPLYSLVEGDALGGTVYTFTKILSETGMIGSILISIAFFWWAVSLFRAGIPEYGHFVLGGFLMMMLGHNVGLYGFLFISGAMISQGNRWYSRIQPITSEDTINIIRHGQFGRSL